MYIWDQLQALQPHTAQKNKPALNEIDASENLGQAEASICSGISLFFCAACRRNAQAQLCSLHFDLLAVVQELCRFTQTYRR